MLNDIISDKNGINPAVPSMIPIFGTFQISFYCVIFHGPELIDMTESGRTSF